LITVPSAGFVVNGLGLALPTASPVNEMLDTSPAREPRSESRPRRPSYRVAGNSSRSQNPQH
jgi:hypothetical protein